MRWLAALSVTVLLVGGCSHAPFYTGDGRFVDNGFMTYSRRFEIDLGPVDASGPGKYKYSLRGLPRARFVVNLQVAEVDQNTSEKKRDYPAVVRVQLRNQKGETVVDEQASLNSWVRGYGLLNNLSELYRMGEGREVPLPGGGARGERVGVKPSGGWGTYFDSEPRETYELSVEILESTMNRPTRVRVVGWGR